MNNEPVAWMEIYKGEPNNLDWDKSNLNYGSEFHDVVPLYTHPVNPKYDPETGEPLIDGYPLFSGLPHPVKELTDEEILSLTGFKDNPYDIFIEYEKEDLIEFARAILRKAQEK